MGGMAAFRSRSVRIPPELSALKGKPCYLPDEADAADLDGHVVRDRRYLPQESAQPAHWPAACSSSVYVRSRL